MCVAHSTYSGIDSSSKPRNTATRFCAATSTTMPRIELSSNAKYSPSPASATASDRHDSSTAPMPATAKRIVRVNVRLSIASARSTTSTFSSHCQIDSPIVAPSAPIVSMGTTCRRMNRARSSPTSSTMHAPPASATSGDSAAQSRTGASGFTGRPL